MRLRWKLAQHPTSPPSHSKPHTPSKPYTLLPLDPEDPNCQGFTELISLSTHPACPHARARWACVIRWMQRGVAWGGQRLRGRGAGRLAAAPRLRWQQRVGCAVAWKLAGPGGGPGPRGPAAAARLRATRWPCCAARCATACGRTGVGPPPTPTLGV